MVNFAYDVVHDGIGWQKVGRADFFRTKGLTKLSQLVPESRLQHYFEDVNVLTVDESLDSNISFVYEFCPDPAIVPTDGPDWLNDVEQYWCKLFTDKRFVSAINDGRCKFVINDSFEGDAWTIEVMRLLVRSLWKWDVEDMENIFVVTASESYSHVENAPFNLVYFQCSESLMREMVDEGQIKPRKKDAKKFLCINNWNKKERFYFGFRCWQEGILDQFNFSHGEVRGPSSFAYEMNLGPSGEEIGLAWAANRNGRKCLVPFAWTDAMQAFADTTPYVYDRKIEEKFETNQWFRIDHNHREDNLLYIVTESCFDNFIPPSILSHQALSPNRDVSEKTWKPIAMKMPFIMVGQPFTLRRLRDIGYRTFYSLWDESYDDIVDAQTRMEKIVEVVVGLSKRDDFVNLIEACNDIVEHNFRMLKLRRPEQEVVSKLSPK